MTKILNFKKIIITILVLALLTAQNSVLILGLGLFSKNNNIEEVNAIYTPVEVDITNSDFESPTSSSYPISPNGWVINSATDGVTSGLINVEQNEYDSNKDDYNLDFNPGKTDTAPASDDKVLMINAENANLKSGYTSADFTLEANSYYIVEFYAYTQDVNGISATATASLTGDTQIEDSNNSITISTHGVWELYKFFVQTDSINNKTINLELWLGEENSFSSQGAVFFDEVKIYSHSNDYYFTQLNLNSASSNYTTLNLNQYTVANAIVNANFEQTISDPETNNTGWETLTADNSVANGEYAVNGIFNIGDGFNTTLTKVAEDPTNANIYENEKALLINNINSASIGFKSSDITINQQQPYKLSVWAKTSDISNGATIKVIEQNPYGEDNETYSIKQSEYTGINTTLTVDEKYEDWQEYSFYILGSAFYNATINLELWLGTEGDGAVGYVWFDNISLTKITTNEYESNESSTYSKALRLSPNAAGIDFANANFNAIDIETMSDTYPLTAQDWTLSSESDNAEVSTTNNGVINTNTTHFNNIKNTTAYYTGFANPGNLDNTVNDEISNNVLMIGNVTETSQTFSSEPYTLTAESFYKASFYIQTQNIVGDNGGRAGVTLKAGDIPIFTLNNIISDYDFTKYTVYIKTSLEDFDITADLKLGTANQEITGYAFFDNVLIEDSDATSYGDAIENAESNTHFLNLTSENFEVTSPNTFNGLYESLNWTASNETTVTNEFIKAGVLDTDTFEANSSYFPTLINPGTESDTGSNVLAISSLNDIYYTYTSDFTQSLNANSYYKLSVFVKTFDLSQLSSNQELEDDEETTISYGASLFTSLSEDKFTGINTQLGNTTNEYQEYIFYISTDSSSEDLSITLALGQANALTSGYAFFSNVSLSSMSESNYTTTTETLAENTSSNLTAMNVNLTSSTSTEDDDTSDNTIGANFDFLVIPTLFMSLALIIAIVGYSIRQIKFNKLVKKKIRARMYDRSKTLKLDHEKRQQIKQREERLKILQTNLTNVEAQIKANEKEYKQTQKELATIDIEKLISTEEKAGLTDKQLNSAIKQKRLLVEKQKQTAYKEKVANLTKEFNKIEKEIELLEKQERHMFEQYTVYRSQVSAIKQEIKAKQKKDKQKAKLKDKNKKAKAKAKKTNNKK